MIHVFTLVKQKKHNSARHDLKTMSRQTGIRDKQRIEGWHTANTCPAQIAVRMTTSSRFNS